MLQYGNILYELSIVLLTCVSASFHYFLKIMNRKALDDELIRKCFDIPSGSDDELDISGDEVSDDPSFVVIDNDSSGKHCFSGLGPSHMFGIT